MRKEGLYLNELIDEVPSKSGKALVYALVSLDVDLYDSEFKFYSDFSKIEKTATVGDFNNGDPIDIIYIAFEKNSAEKILGFKLEVSEEELNVQHVQIKGLRFVSYCDTFWVDGTEVIAMGWSSLTENLDKIDPCWDEDKIKVLEWIDKIDSEQGVEDNE